MDAEQLLRRLGATGKLKGFYQAVYMIEQVRENPAAAALITKRLYPETSKCFDASPSTVERNLRTVIRTCWNWPDHTLLEELAGIHLYRQPTNREFLDMTAAYLRRQSQT